MNKKKTWLLALVIWMLGLLTVLVFANKEEGLSGMLVGISIALTAPMVAALRSQHKK